MAANTAATASTEASTETTSTLPTLIVNDQLEASTNRLVRDCFIDCRCMTGISGHQSLLTTYTEYPSNPKMGKG